MLSKLKKRHRRSFISFSGNTCLQRKDVSSFHGHHALTLSGHSSNVVGEAAESQVQVRMELLASRSNFGIPWIGCPDGGHSGHPPAFLEPQHGL